ncbi:MAG: S24/S26 family peptidase [Prevotellaceae bacterium]|nr:S24/S26 family peptidase [Prevotellaceae bacterium]
MPQGDIKVTEKQFSNAILIPEIIKMINEGHTVTLPLKGFSMRPFLEDGRDKALLTKPVNPKVGDPVLAETYPLHFVLHRIIKIDGDDVVLRGDGNLGNEYCKMSDVKAAVIGFYRKGRTTLDRTDGKKWRVYSFVWMHLSPIRRYLLAFHRRIWLRLFPSKHE